MERRNILITTGGLLTVPLTGCVDSVYTSSEDENESNTAESDGLANSRNMSLRNRMDENVSVSVYADADGDEIVSSMFELDAGWTSKSIATVPEGINNLTVEVEVNSVDQLGTEQRSFDLPKTYQIQEFGIWIRDETIGIEATPVATPD